MWPCEWRFLHPTATRERGRRPRSDRGKRSPEACAARAVDLPSATDSHLGRNDAPRRRARASAVLRGVLELMRKFSLQRGAFYGRGGVRERLTNVGRSCKAE